MITQSEGSELGSRDGNEHTLRRVAVAAPKSASWTVVTATESAELHAGLSSQSLVCWWVGLVRNGSLLATTDVVPVDVNDVSSVGPPQRSELESAVHT